MKKLTYEELEKELNELKKEHKSLVEKTTMFVMSLSRTLIHLEPLTELPVIAKIDTNHEYYKDRKDLFNLFES